MIKYFMTIVAVLALGYVIGMSQQKDKQIIQQDNMESLCTGDAQWEAYLAFESDILEYTCFKQNVQTNKIIKQLLVTK